jgi:hypothetical protein
MDELLEREMEEKLREAASVGDMDTIKNLVEYKSVNVNSQNKMNGRYVACALDNYVDISFG